ncbi:MAG: NADPH-dependent assimilatory sulfite reductase hemoprotein subunit [Alphaproteobacteria bacterium]|nr:NADPH-dependent assimilatory sulfite reductase hemoprotein subunit [Alphaproteobacteria bacterium]
MNQETKPQPPSPTEGVKERSRGLRGTLEQSLRDQLTGQLAADDQSVIKFHGIYQQDDRDRREARERKKLERDYSFMIRLRLPAGEITPAQWLGIAHIAQASGNGVVKITTRQTVQIHGVIKSKMKPTMQSFAALGVDTISACGDVNRNVLAGAHPSISPFHAEVQRFAAAISEHLLPKTRAYSEIWLDGEKLSGDEPEEDPLYGKHYLPRKFKIALVIPPINDTDVLANDIGLIAVEEKGKFTGFNVAVGGGMGTTHGSPDTYPRLATTIGFVPKDKTLEVVWQITAIQRDFGNRSDRKLARLKYTVDRMGIERFKEELHTRLGYALAPARDVAFTARADLLGWQQDQEERWYYTLFVENGRVVDAPGYALKTGLCALAQSGLCGFRFTASQNIMLTYIAPENRAKIQALLEQHGLAQAEFSPTRQEAIACVALNTCPLALAEAQRYMPSFITKIEALLEKHDLRDAPISIRMTGCPNGCARPHLAEIGLVGRSLGHYNLHLGGDALGLRLNRLYAENLDESGILAALEPLLAAYAKERRGGERFGDYIERKGIAA